jgi:hypothetical protein
MGDRGCLGLDEGGVHLQGVGGDSIAAEGAGGEGVAHLPGLGVAHPAEPVPHGIGERVVAEQREEGVFALQLPQVLQGPSAGLQQQDDRLDEDLGRIAPVTSRLREPAIEERPQTETVGELREQGEAPWAVRVSSVRSSLKGSTVCRIMASPCGLQGM